MQLATQMPNVRAIFGEVITRLLDGDMKDRRNDHGRTYIEQLARDIFLDPKKAELTARARLPEIKRSLDEATVLNRPKDAIMCQLSRCTTLDATFFTNFPARLRPLGPWRPAGGGLYLPYLPLNRWGHPLGKGPDWRGDLEEYLDSNEAIFEAWHFAPDDGTPREPLYDAPIRSSDRRKEAAFLATYASRLRRVLAEAKPSDGGLVCITIRSPVRALKPVRGALATAASAAADDWD
jgi:hypothetical protein